MRDTQNLRCSRPLCSSQTTTPVNTPPTPPKEHRQACPGKPETPTTTPHPHQETNHTKRDPPPDPGRVQPLLPQDPTVCHTPPNQQPTSPFHNPHPQPPQRREADTSPYSNQPAPTRHLSVDIPPMSTHRRTNACAMGILLTTPTPHTTRDMNSCRRSLERR